MQTNTIYLNHAGTSWPKPETVLEQSGALPRLDPAQWSAVFDAAHCEVAHFFHVDPSRLLLTPSCTAALAIAIVDQPWQAGDRVVTSHYEHHALHRHLVQLSEREIEVRVLPRGDRQLIQLEGLEAELRSGRVRLVALTAACNVTGQLLPVKEAVELSHAHGATVLVDGAQIAGWWDLDLTQLGADLFTFAGHKGPQAPWGIGGLYVSAASVMNCPQATCELSDVKTDRALMPGYCDVGSVNVAALAGLAAGCRWLLEPERIDRLDKARRLAREFSDSIRDLPGVKIQHDVPVEEKVPTVAIRVEGMPATDLATRLRDHGVIASGGFQCSPQAHLALGTSQNGVLRFSFGPQNVASEVAAASEILRQLVAS